MNTRHLVVFMWFTSIPMATSWWSMLLCLTLPPYAILVWLLTVLESVFSH
jgi:hypothetical protein